MHVHLLGVTVENAEEYNGKNGWGANISFSELVDKKRETNYLLTKNETIYKDSVSLLQQKVNVTFNWIQNSFGNRIGEIVSLSPASVNSNKDK